MNANLNEDLDVLYGYSLISPLASGDTCEMHSLVQLCTKIWLSFDDVKSSDIIENPSGIQSNLI